MKALLVTHRVLVPEDQDNEAKIAEPTLHPSPQASMVQTQNSAEQGTPQDRSQRTYLSFHAQRLVYTKYMLLSPNSYVEASTPKIMV